MKFKRILVPFAGYARDFRALRTALDLARTHKAHVEAWHISIDPAEVVNPNFFPLSLDGYLSGESFEDIQKTSRRCRERAERLFAKAIKASRVSMEKDVEEYPIASFHSATGRAENILSKRARICDLTVMCRAEDGARFSQVLASVLFGSGRPLLLLPPKKTKRYLNGRTLVAWNSSVEASRAVAFSLPLLEQDKVWVLAAQGKSGAGAHHQQAQNLVSYLDLHGINAEASKLGFIPAEIPWSILQAARESDAGLIVMGAYGHSRLQEFFCGGVTDFMLKNADTPLLLAH